MEEEGKELTPEEIAHLIDRTGRADTYSWAENYGFSRQLCELAGLADKFDEIDEAGGDYEDVVCEAAKKLNVYSIIYGEKVEA